MWTRLHTQQTVLSATAIVLVIVLFFAVNILADALLKGVRIDLTEDRLYTVTDATKSVLAGIEEPIRLRFYRSQELADAGPYFATHIRRMDEMLDTYARLAEGMLIVERYDPRPFSPEEDLAVSDGARGLTVSADGTLAYLAIAGSNSTDDRRTIPFLAPDRADFLEYDLTRMIHDLAHPEKPVVAVLGDLPLFGDPMTGRGPWLIVEAMEQAFTVRDIETASEGITEDVDVLMLVQPGALDETDLYAIDQFVLGGGRVLAFVDPLPEVLERMQSRQPAGDAVAAMAPLLTAWGVEVSEGRVVGDRDAAMRVRARHEDRPVVTDYLPWLELTPDNFATEMPATGDLRLLVMKSAGAIRSVDAAVTTLQPLIQTGPQAAEIAAERLRFLPDPVALLREFAPGGMPLVLAARISGPASSAFPEGPPEHRASDGPAGVAQMDLHRAAADHPIEVILVADSDILVDENYVQASGVGGQRFVIPTANNADFALNALEQLRGGEMLAGLRGRGVTQRRFDVLEETRRRAEDAYRESEQALLANIEETRQRIAGVQHGEADGSAVLTAEQQAAIEDSRQRLLQLRQELRDVQYALRHDVERLERRVTMLNIWAVPAVITLSALVVALVRRRRATRARRTAPAS
ncbi:MAG: ABC transporter [Rhodospirillales bacterium]|nr:MAG: ABC transporter [Rhodospirillales bacterium]